MNATHLLGVSLRGRITTAHFQETNDVPALFVADSCVRDPNARERAGRLYREYKHWCEDNGHRPLSSTRVAEDWRRLGFEQSFTKHCFLDEDCVVLSYLVGVTCWRGIRLKTVLKVGNRRVCCYDGRCADAAKDVPDRLRAYFLMYRHVEGGGGLRSKERWQLTTAELGSSTSCCPVVHPLCSVSLGHKQETEKHDKRADVFLDESGGGG